MIKSSYITSFILNEIQILFLFNGSIKQKLMYITLQSFLTNIIPRPG